MVCIFHQVIKLGREGAGHVTFVLRRDFLWGSAIDDIGAVTDTYKEGSKHDGEIKAVTCLPFVKDIGRRGDKLWKRVRHAKLLVSEVVGHELCTILVVVKLSERQLCGPDGRANELALAALVLGSKQKLSRWIIDDLELARILKHMLQNQLFFGGVLGVATWNIIAEL